MNIKKNTKNPTNKSRPLKKLPPTNTHTHLYLYTPIYIERESQSQSKESFMISPLCFLFLLPQTVVYFLCSFSRNHFAFAILRCWFPSFLSVQLCCHQNPNQNQASQCQYQYQSMPLSPVLVSGVPQTRIYS